MKATSLLIVFAIGKAAALWGRDIPLSWTAVAYIWQDVLAALLFGGAEIMLRKTPTSRASVGLHFALAAYAALNIPVMMVLATPLTWPMLRATSGTIADSILLYATLKSVLLVALAMTVAVALPPVLGRLSSRAGYAAAATALLILMIGPAARARVDTFGLDRNVLFALVASTLPHVQMRASAGDWTTPLFERHDGDDLAHLRGAARARNIVLVSLESTAAQYLRLYGATENVMPRLDALASQGVVFENAYAAYPESIKGLFSVLCSTYPAFDTTAEQYSKPPCHPLPALLSKAGYDTALFHSGRFAYLGMDAVTRHRGYDVLEDAGNIGGNHESSFGVDEASTVARMLQWIDGRPADRRFFLTYLPIAGHHPYETPVRGPFPEDQEIGRYRNALRYADDSLGALVDGLKVRGLDRETVWVIIGDHGEAFGQHHGNYGHTFFLYEENVRVPFVVSVPGSFAQRRSRTIVSLVDTAPTILDLVGLSIPGDYQGHSALDGRGRMALFYTDYSLGLLGLRDGPWKFVHELDSGRPKLFDLTRDAEERQDLAAQHAARVAAYTQTLRAWSAAQKAYVMMSDQR
jgi:arylsulfatase A-like enzyme